MNERQKNIILVIVISFVFFGFSFWSWLKPADEYSLAERRHLAKMPELSIQSVFERKSFMSDFEKYSADQFPMREAFRTINAGINKYIFGQKLINGIYIENGYEAKPEYPLNESSIEWATSVFRKIYERYLSESRVYISVIPDKGYFLAEKGRYPSLGYEEFFDKVRTASGDFAEYIDLTSCLTIENFYKTDTHWRQETLLPVSDALLTAMTGQGQRESFSEVTVSDSFYGVYAGQISLKTEPDELKYLTNDILDGLIVNCFDSGEQEKMPLYDTDKAGERDGYEMYLSGALALITIENPRAETDRELVIFRDSFGSSIAPLLCGSYKKVTLADIRYISPSALGKYISFDNTDVLFLYSVSVLNNSQGQILG